MSNTDLTVHQPEPAVPRTLAGPIWDDDHGTDLSFLTIEEVLLFARNESQAQEQATLPALTDIIEIPDSPGETVATWRAAFLASASRGDRGSRARPAVIWRTTRWLLGARGVLNPDESLQDLLLRYDGPATLLDPPTRRPTPPYSRRGAGPAALVLLDANPPIPVLPDRADRTHLERLQAAHHLAAMVLQVTRTNAGQLALQDLTPTRFPPLQLLVDYEQTLIAEVGRIIGTKTTQQAHLLLHEREGLQPAEIRGVLAMARRWCQAVTAATLEDRQAMMIMRLEDAAARARENLDLRTELGVARLLIKVQGLSERAGEAGQDKALLRLMDEHPLPQPQPSP